MKKIGDMKLEEKTEVMRFRIKCLIIYVINQIDKTFTRKITDNVMDKTWTLVGNKTVNVHDIKKGLSLE
jgi:hypothetical protein